MITTHVLNLASGNPAAGIEVELSIQMEGNWQKLGSGTTDTDGRINNLLEPGHELQNGIYQLTFQVDDGFYSLIPIQFKVTEKRHYHVPLLLSPYGYSTYRGS